MTVVFEQRNGERYGQLCRFGKKMPTEVYKKSWSRPGAVSHQLISYNTQLQVRPGTVSHQLISYNTQLQVRPGAVSHQLISYNTQLQVRPGAVSHQLISYNTQLQVRSPHPHQKFFRQFSITKVKLNVYK